MYRRADGAECGDYVWSSISSPRQAGHPVVSTLRQCQARSMVVVSLHQPLGLRRTARLACTSRPAYLLALYEWRRGLLV